jgi:hypothetical protein
MMWACLSRAYERHLRPKESQDSFPTQQLFVLGKQPLIIAININPAVFRLFSSLLMD